MAAISLRAPLLFIDGPPLTTVVQIEKEESTTIYWKPEPEPETDKKLEDESEASAVKSQTADFYEDSEVVRKIRYLAEPFPRTAYRPLQFLVNGQLLTGGIVGLSGSEIAVEVTEESQSLEEIRTLDLRTIEEVFWKGQPFR
ncbi:hypothetical protein [Sporosarcina trichiuri]|uniref:hypothetical protein n=1 Tax=Sporosarcina trichiuri TaxID=3056445 RepID=UPI0025B5F397|nr:hypothetical protein [Sporosarcina sp. 0.2-SM1T-5]WJY28923.1 hypothetical protein QWT68_08045 [Sporosarcina sp. 0.2-SM1T-5]